MRPLVTGLKWATTRLKAGYMSRPGRVFISTTKILAAAHLSLTYFYSWGTVSGPSMLPEWEVWGDGVVTSQLYRRGKGIKVGDLIKFKVPVTDQEAVKRVAGLPGDYVLIHSPDSGREEMIQVTQDPVDFKEKVTDDWSIRFPRDTAGFWEIIYMRRGTLGCTGPCRWL